MRIHLELIDEDGVRVSLVREGLRDGLFQANATLPAINEAVVWVTSSETIAVK